MKISACMITKNEEKNIARCINSYKSIVEEIIVVDTGSTDDTVNIAKNLGAKIFRFEWVNDFAKAKNYALSKAKEDWIIFLDADEYFDQDKAKNIPNLIKKYDKSKNYAIACKMINIDEDSGVVSSSMTQGRIFKKSAGIYYVGAIHETLHTDGEKIDGVYIQEDQLVIYHLGYSEKRKTEKAERNLALLLKELERPEIDPKTYSFISDAYIALGEYEKAIYYGREFLQNKVDMIGLNSKVYQNMIFSMMELKFHPREVEKIALEAIEAFPTHPMFRVYLADVYHSIKRYQEALEIYEKSIIMQNEYSDIEINPLTGNTYKVQHAIAQIYEYRNQEEKALDYYTRVLREKKDYLPSLQGLLKLTREIDETTLITLLNQLYDKNNLEEMDFLIEELVKQRYKKVLAYYVNWIHSKYNKQDLSLVVMFLTNNKYQHAFKHFQEAYLLQYDSSYAKLAITSAYLARDDIKLLNMKKIVKPSLKRIIEALLTINGNYYLYKEDAQDYLNILREVILIGTEEDRDAYLKLKKNFTDDITNLDSTIANTLKEHKNYEIAIALYKEELLKQTVDEKNIHLSIGYCYYKLRAFKLALDHFKKALESGYVGNDLKELLQWTMEQTKEMKVSSSAHNLIEEFNLI